MFCERYELGSSSLLFSKYLLPYLSTPTRVPYFESAVLEVNVRVLRSNPKVNELTVSLFYTLRWLVSISVQGELLKAPTECRTVKSLKTCLGPASQIFFKSWVMLEDARMVTVGTRVGIRESFESGVWG